MQNSGDYKIRHIRLGYYMIAFAVIWTIISAASLFWNISQRKQTTRELATREARAHFYKDQAFRFWGTSHGGVYVPIDERTPPNEHLKHVPERDITTPAGIKLTLMNPAYMVRQLMEDFEELYKVKGRITSMKPFRPQNMPDEWERSALESFEQGVKEVFEYAFINGQPYIRLIRPMITKKGCLKCHAVQGYKEGDIRGGVGVSVPMEPYLVQEGREINMLVLTYIMLWLLGIGGIFIGFRGLNRHIVERDRAEETMRKSEEKYRFMMEAMKDPVTICSSDYRIEYMNPAMIKRTGRDATGDRCFKAVHDLDEKCPWCLHHKTQAGDHFTTDIVSPKDKRSYHIAHSPIFHEDGSVSKMTIFRDTTDYKKMETQLQQAQKMEAIGTLAGGIAHDFNNILFPIFGYLEMILIDITEDNPLRGNLIEVFNGAKRARDLIKQILAFSRQKDHELKPLKTQLVIKEALKLIKSSLPSTIEINQNIKSDCGLVFADPTQIHQIVMNLCTNAYHALEETGGKLTVHLKEVVLAVEDLKDPAMMPGKYVCLTVTDTGTGMDQGVIDRIFDPYFTTKEEGKGTGLGLAIAHGIAKSHGGHISVYSEPGKGTEFHVYLPIIKTVEETAKVETDTPIQKGDERILLVDDQDIVVQMEKQMLERLGYHVTVRTSSTDALEAFKANPDRFDLIITDMTMPNMTGEQLAGEIMKIRSDIPVILCTGFSERMSKEKAEFLGIKGFLMKPVVMSDFSSMIRKVLDNKVKLG